MYAGQQVTCECALGDSQKNSEKEDLYEIQETEKELGCNAYLQKGIYLSDESNINKAVYQSGKVSEITLAKRGSVTIDDITIKDSLKHSELIEFVQILFRSKELLLNQQELSKEDEKRKRKLLTLLCNLNWGFKTPTLQVRLLRSMEERLKLLKLFL